MKVFDATKVIYEFKSGLDVIGEVNVGESFTVHCNDCFSQQVRHESDLISNIDFSQVNPATGPIYINGAEVGDVLKVDILDIRLADQGSIVVLPGGGLLGDLVNKPATRIVTVKDGMVDFLGIKQAIDPMIGVIGVSPGAKQDGVVTGTPGNHGGNMDTTDVRIGSSLYFPVREQGAMLALGDCHAVMGDGEVCVAGLEIEAEVDLKVSLIKNKQIEWPLLENDKEFMAIVSGETLDDAIYQASKVMCNLVERGLGITWNDAYMFNSMFVDYKISQAVNPMKTVRAVVSKELLDFTKI